VRCPGVLVFLLLVACGGPAAAPAPADRLAPPRSVVFGDGGGTVVVGLLLPLPEPVVYADLVPEEKLRAFEAAEAGRADEREPPPEIPPEEIIEWPEHYAWSRRVRVLAPVAERVLAATGVRVDFREVTALECGGVPCLLAEERELSEVEAPLLRRYVEAGGVLVREAGAFEAERLEAIVREAIARSPLVVRLPADPTRLQDHTPGALRFAAARSEA